RRRRRPLWRSREPPSSLETTYVTSSYMAASLLLPHPRCEPATSGQRRCHVSRSSAGGNRRRRGGTYRDAQPFFPISSTREIGAYDIVSFARLVRCRSSFLHGV